MKQKKVFVTVGTTKFEKLIKLVSSKSVLDLLADLGYAEVQFQVGNGAYSTEKHERLRLSYAEYYDDFGEQIRTSDLVISHAGAGTCVEVLRHGRPLIVVVNEDLMDNHQVELAEQLQKDEFLYCCTCDSLVDALRKDPSALRKYPKPSKHAFGGYLNKCMGFPS